MTPRERRVAEAAVAALIPAGGSLRWSGQEVGVVRRLEADLASWPVHVRRRVRLLFVAFELAPLLLGRRPFSRLGPRDREDVCRRLAAHRVSALRLLVGFVQQVCFAVYVQTPEVEAALGYDGSCLRERTDG